MFDHPKGRGGAGGGALEIVALNDITLGPRSKISFPGEAGFRSYMTAGGGGSGGAILLSAGGAIRVEGELSVKGGDGGVADAPDSKIGIGAAGGHGGAGAGGRIAMFGETIAIDKNATISYGGGVGAAGCKTETRQCDGGEGTFYRDALLHHEMFVDDAVGAAGTAHSLFLSNSESERTQSDVEKDVPFVQNGPIFTFPTSQPGRVTYFVRVADKGVVGEAAIDEDGWGTTFELRQGDFTDFANSKKHPSNIVIGVRLGKTFTHGSGYNAFPGDQLRSAGDSTFEKYAKTNVWYKVDIRINWTTKTYDVFLDDVRRVSNAAFVGAGVDSVGLSTYRKVAAWYDEIFAGTDTTMDFRCPMSTDSGLTITRPIQTGWKASNIGEASSNHKMERHESHLSRREMYNWHNGKLNPFDGDGHRAFNSDIKFRLATGDRRGVTGSVNAGSMLAVKSNTISKDIAERASTSAGDYGGPAWDEGSASNPNNLYRYYWYGEHTNAAAARPGYAKNDKMQGGVAACSTDDFVTWRNEGIMLNYANITDMVFGKSGPFFVERPKVLHNALTNKYVMWMSIDDVDHTLGLAGVAVSEYPDGPFEFVRSFFPDGNETHDLTVYQNETDPSEAYLARTYYATVDYILPAPVLQPLWESVKNPDGTVNYGLSYHRAMYEPMYDDYHDIYLQRWRTEDKPWKVVCVHKVTGVRREIPHGVKNFDGDVCEHPVEYKIVEGQGQLFGDDLPTNPREGIASRFLDPTDVANSWWKPSSVPSVKAQPWSANYKEGFCGNRKLDDDLKLTDPLIGKREESSRRTCSNIVDNAVHPTPPDKLIGVNTVVEKRRAKYVAISKLTDDFLDTSGVLTAYEGEMEEEKDLVTLIKGFKKQFNWGPGHELRSTYMPQRYVEGFEMADDFATRFHQFEENFNDRAFFSLACKLDGSCPVNFRDQILAHSGNT